MYIYNTLTDFELSCNVQNKNPIYGNVFVFVCKIPLFVPSYFVRVGTPCFHIYVAECSVITPDGSNGPN